MDTSDDIYLKALVRRSQISDDIKDILAEDPINRVKLYDACRDYVKMDDFLEVCLKFLEEEDDENFDYHCKDGVKCDRNDKDEAKNDEDDDLLPAPNFQTFHKTLKINVTQEDDDDDDTVDVKVNAGRNGGKIQELLLSKDQKKKIANLIEQSKFEELAEFLDECLDDQVEELGDTLDDLGKSLKEIRNDLVKKDTRIEKEEKRLNALDKLFERVEKAFSDD